MNRQRGLKLCVFLFVGGVIWTYLNLQQQEKPLTRPDPAIAQIAPAEPATEPMTVDKLATIVESVASDIQRNGDQLQFVFENRPVILLTSQEYDRMRLISPITEADKIGAEEREKILVANFHSALDARYAITDGVVFAAFLHPLSTLHERDFLSALRQVSQLAQTFGTTYSSSGVLFGPGQAPPSNGPRPDSQI